MNYRKLFKIFDDLFPIIRSITGLGYKKSLEILSKYIDLKYIKYKSGKKIFDWPTYMLQPEYTGMTFNETINSVDAGNIVYQNSAKIRPEDGVHENACRVVKEFCDKLPNLLEKKLTKKTKIKSLPQCTSGKIWTKKNWTPLNLKVIYDLFDDRVNKFCLDNRKIIKPKILNFLEE